MVIKMQRFLEMDLETAETQVDLVVNAYDSIVSSRTTLANLAEGQTTSLWTADGNSVALAAALTTRYASALKWLDAIEANLRAAAENIALAIKETTQLNESQKDGYSAQLEKILGTRTIEA
ncbi:MAG: hypothetical protein JF592_10400 [Microbacterium sp.]|uniref:Uncharacterized protein n=1 Tax=Microbacterium natoriense TaxID=284570 RepID=A0AAW8EUR0_9MICO|nr:MULTISPECIES: hypothetical protein [Microbacterium]MBW8762982.1 hypothetical protein [Microbacterium sp.]MDQ0646842.1 hypothetical protein [Microbacterium natoriense]